MASLGLYLVRPPWRGRGYGLRLWRHAMEHLADLRCIGLEAAPDRISDYASWGFEPASPTIRWQAFNAGALLPAAATAGWRLLAGMDRGAAPPVSLGDVYGLACLELG